MASLLRPGALERPVRLFSRTGKTTRDQRQAMRPGDPEEERQPRCDMGELLGCDRAHGVHPRGALAFGVAAQAALQIPRLSEGERSEPSRAVHLIQYIIFIDNILPSQ